MKTHESYVSLETAKMLKEAGFDWECWGNYSPKGTFQQIVFEWKPMVENWNNTPNAKNCTSAPTIEVAQRWLREVKRHDVFVSPCNGLYFYTVRKYYHEGKVDYFDYPNKDAFDTYEEALEAGIKKLLEIILKK